MSEARKAALPIWNMRVNLPNLHHFARGLLLRRLVSRCRWNISTNLLLLAGFTACLMNGLSRKPISGAVSYETRFPVRGSIVQ